MMELVPLQEEEVAGAFSLLVQTPKKGHVTTQQEGSFLKARKRSKPYQTLALLAP